ncbi:MAG: zinc ribbon domain-containing protein [Nitrospiraceae bacterium]
MPIYEYLAQHCLRQQPCSKRLEYLQPVAEAPLSHCRDCGAAIQRVFSTFAARTGAVCPSVPDPTPLNITGMPAPSSMPTAEGGGACEAHDHGGGA